MKFIYLIDSSGNASVTLTFVTLSWVIATLALFTGNATLGEYSASISAFLVTWVAREHVKRK